MKGVGLYLAKVGCDEITSSFFSFMFQLISFMLVFASIEIKIFI